MCNAIFFKLKILQKNQKNTDVSKKQNLFFEIILIQKFQGRIQNSFKMKHFSCGRSFFLQNARS